MPVEDGEGGQQAGGGIIGGEEVEADDRGELRIESEIEPLHEVADATGRDGLTAGARQLLGVCQGLHEDLLGRPTTTRANHL